jgi:hypothetical protein
MLGLLLYSMRNRASFFFPILILLAFAPVITIVFGEYSYDIWNQVMSLQALPEDIPVQFMKGPIGELCILASMR